MNKRQILASLNKVANTLDLDGLHNEADSITKVMSRIANNFDEEYDKYVERTQKDYEKPFDNDDQFLPDEDFDDEEMDYDYEEEDDEPSYDEDDWDSYPLD